MDKLLQMTIRNSDLVITKEKRVFLTYPADGLANCSLEELEDGICLTFDTEGLVKPEDIFSKNSNSGMGKSREQQLRFLINCADLEGLYAEYDFSLSTDNILVDINLRPQVLLRDVKNGRAGIGLVNSASNGNGSASNIGAGSKTNIAVGSKIGSSKTDRDANDVDSEINGKVKVNNRANIGISNDSSNSNYTAITTQRFLPKYLALIGSFLLRKYNYEDFEKGGQDLYKKNKLLLELSEMENTTDIKNRLIKEYNKRIDKITQTKKLVPRRNAIIARIAIPVLTLSFLAAGFFAGMALLFDIPYKNQVIIANEAYIAGNPLEVQRALSDFPVHNLTHETRHILSRSYVATEPISDAQRGNILMGLTLITDSFIFDYWIHLGRMEFYEAIDIAQRFGDNELLLFAYIRQEAIVRADPHMPGSEKVALLSYIENRIDALQRDRESVEEHVVNAANEVADDETDEINEYLYDLEYPYDLYSDDYNDYGYQDDEYDLDYDENGQDGDNDN